MRFNLPAAVVAAAVLLPVTASAQASMGIAHAPGITFHSAPASSRADAPARDDSARGGHRGEDGGHRDRGNVGDLFLADAHTYAPRYDARSSARRHSRKPPYLRVVPYFLPSAEPGGHASVDGRSALAQRGTPAGLLKLTVEPRSARVYIDGFPFGPLDEAGASQVLLEAGTHRVEIEADGFEPSSFDIRIRANDTLAHSAKLTHADTAPPVVPAVTPASPKTLYIIPRCYAGDRRPDASQLPDGCDPADLRIISADR